MKTIDELNNAILAITMIIKEEHPELSKYLSEMGETIPDTRHPVMDSKTLQDYYDSLATMLKEYAPNHSHFTK
jgi:hypothetical protein